MLNLEAVNVDLISIRCVFLLTGWQCSSVCFSFILFHSHPVFSSPFLWLSIWSSYPTSLICYACSRAPSPANLLSWLCVTSLLSLSLSLSSSYWLLCFHYCIIHHSDPCALWYPGACGWKCVCSAGVMQVCVEQVPQVIITSTGSVCSRVCVSVWLWSPQKLVRNIQLISLFPLLTLTHPSFSFLTAFLLYYFGDTLEDYPADLYQIWRFRQLEGKLWSEARPERCELLNVSGCLRGLWSSFVTVWAI